jgi:hypothetical protein
VRLTARIKSRKAQHNRRSLREIASDWLQDIYYPSLRSLAIVGILLSIIHVLIRWSAQCHASDESARVARLQPIGIGIALIFVPITVFAVGLSSRRTPSGVTTAEIILKETYLFPIAILVIGLVANFVWVTTVTAAITLIMLTLAFAIFTVYRLALSLLDEHHQYFSGISILQDKIKRSINLAVDERLGKDLLLKSLEDMPIEYSPFVIDDPGQSFYVRHTRQGIVQDVLLDKLSEFANELERLANDNNCSYSEKKVLISAPSSVLGPINPANERTLQIVKSRYLTKLFGDPLDEDLVIARFPLKLVPDPSERERLAQIAIGAIVVRQDESYSKRVQRLLATIKDEAIRVIQGRQTGALVDLLHIYTHLAEAFLKEMTKYGGYSFADARRENQNIHGGWNEVRWISSQLYEIHYRGCRSGDRFVAREVSAAPNSIAYAAIRYRDHLLFSEFTSFALHLYLRSGEADDESVRSLLFDRSWRYLQELGDYGVEWQLRRTEDSSPALETIGDFGTTILLRYQELLKASLEKASVSDFTTFRECASGLFRNIGTLHNNASEITNLSFQLSQPGLSDEDRHRITQRVDRLSTLQRITNNLDSQRQQMFFGVGSLTLDKSLGNPGRQEFSAIREQTELIFGQDIVAVTNIYIKCCELKVQDLWGWEWWDKIPERGGFVAGRSFSLTQYYCYLFLKRSQSLRSDEVMHLDLPRVKDFIFEIGPQGRITSILDSFSNDREKWAHLVPDAWLPAITILRALFTKVISYQKHEDDERIIASEINRNRVQEFKSGFITKFEESALLRNIFVKFGAFLDDSSAVVPSSDTKRWGVNTLDDKAAYIQDGGRLYREWGENYGWQLAASESSFAMEIALKKLPRFSCQDEQAIDAKLLAAADTLQKSGTTPTLVLTALDAQQRIELEGSEHFKSAWRTGSRKWNGIFSFEGLFSFGKTDVPVFVVAKMATNVACVLDLAKCLRWIQKSPADTAIEIQDLYKFFFFSVVDLARDDGLRNGILTDNPPWLAQYTDPDNYLRQRVYLRILERFDVELLDSKAGYKIVIN